MKKIGIVLLVSASQIFAITPGKWSPMDRYVLGLDKNGPKQEIVKDKEGSVIYTASYEYDEEGRLIREIYKKGNGESDGENALTYEKNRITTEELLSSEGVQEKKVYKYNINGDLKEIIVYGADGKELIRYKIIGLSQDLIVEAEIRWVRLKETEYFILKKDPTDAKVLLQEILDDKKRHVATVKYFLDEKNNILKRENIQAGSRRMSEVKYNEAGRVISYDFSIFRDNDWVKVKTHDLSY